MKCIRFVLAAIALCVTMVPYALAEGTSDITVARLRADIVVDGVEVRLPLSEEEYCDALVCGKTVYIPLMTASQWLGADISYDQKEEKIIIVANGSGSVCYTWSDLVNKGFVESDWKGLGDGARLRRDIEVVADGRIQSFTDGNGELIYPLEFQEYIFLPLEGVAELWGKETANGNMGFLDLVHVYDVPSQAELEEADTCLAAVRRQMDVVRAVVTGEKPTTEDEFLSKVRQVQTALKAVIEIPEPSFRALSYYTDQLQGRTLLTLWGSVDAYLPEADGSGAAELLHVPPMRSLVSRSFEQEWLSFRDHMLANRENTTTYFMELEQACFDSEVFLAKVKGQPEPEPKLRPTLQVPTFTVPDAVAVDAADFTDAADVRQWEAVAALAKLGIMTGKDDGAFRPGDTLTRAEAAKLLTVLMCGGRGVELDGRYERRFSDTEDHWALPYIEYCVDLGILAGRGDGRFDPDAPVTALELCKIALVALGYDPTAYMLTGNRWAEKTDELARWTVPSLYKGLDSVALTQAITRDDAAQIFYNALQAVPKRALGGHFSEDGRFVFHFVDAVKKDGSPATMLYCQFGLDEVTDLPAQPGNQ